MSVGQRIAQKRKELGLSQENLGEKLGVSRQAIYKWESDAALPEIEKLIALSRIFSVPVGWILGVEEASAEQPSGGELTEEQLEMVREIVDRYLAAQPAPAQPSRRRKWPWVLVGVVLLVVFVSLFSRLNELKNQYNNLQNSIYNVTEHVNRDISSITQRVEEVLKSQNELTADYGTELTAADLGRNTVTFTARAVPKTYTEGMTAVFLADTGDGPAEYPAELKPGREFWAEITCELTDDITLSVVFITGDKRETQILDKYDYLYSGSFPFLYLTFPLWFSVEGDALEPDVTDVNLENNIDLGKDFGNGQQARPVSIRVGLFRDQELVLWYTETVRDVIVNGEPTTERVWVREDVFRLERGHIYCEAAVVTDQFGRERVYFDSPIEFREAEGEWGLVQTEIYSSDPGEWTY